MKSPWLYSVSQGDMKGKKWRSECSGASFYSAIFFQLLVLEGFAYLPIHTRRMVPGGLKLWVINDCARQQEARADPSTQSRSAAGISLLLLPFHNCPSTRSKSTMSDNFLSWLLGTASS